MNAATYTAGAFEASQQFGSLQNSRNMLLPLNQLIATLLLILLSPLFAIIVFLIWQSDGGPVLFAHYRVAVSYTHLTLPTTILV